MKTTILTLFAIFCTSVFYGQSNYDKDVATLLVNFDPSYMKKYEYQTDKDYVVEESYTNYHIPLDKERTLILKIFTKTQQVANVPTDNYTVLSKQDLFSVNRSLISRVNTLATNLYFRIDKELYKVDYTIYKKMEKTQMSYFAPPHFSFLFQYKEDYYPGQAIQVNGDEWGFVTRHFYHGASEVEGIQNDVLLKMYNDACYKRPYGVTTPLSKVGEQNPYKSVRSKVTGEKMFRSCQHPIQSEYLKGIGLYKEFYQEDGKTYRSELVSIDDIPIKTYLKLAKPNYKYDEPKVTAPNASGYAMKSPSTNNGSGDLNISDNIPGKKTVYTTKGVSSNEYKRTSKIIPMVQPTIKQAEVKGIQITAKPTIKQNENIHRVVKGETLYRLSKRYNISVYQLKNINNLKNNIIEINQELVVRAN